MPHPRPKLRIRAGQLTDEHIGMDILSGTRWLAHRRLEMLEHYDRHVVVGQLGYDALTAATDAELVLAPLFTHRDRREELTMMLQWYARAYRTRSLSPEHLGVARARAVAFAREALDAGQGGPACQRVLDLQIGTRDHLLALAQTGAAIPAMLREAGLELQVRSITRDSLHFHWEMPATEKLHAGIRQCDPGHKALIEDQLRHYAAFCEVPAPTLDHRTA